MRNRVPPRTMLALFCLLGFSLLKAWFPVNGQAEQPLGGMLNPSMDIPTQPFSYFAHPTGVLGALLDPVASEVTPEGYIYTGFGELMFFIGNPPLPTHQRIRTLERGYLPVVQYQVKNNDLIYQFTMFAADLGAGLKGTPVNFVRVEVRNDSTETRTGFFTSGFRVDPPRTTLSPLSDYRFIQKFDLIPKRFTDGQVRFDPHWKYSFKESSLIRNGSILYTFPQEPKPFQTLMTERDSGLGMSRYLNGGIDRSGGPLVLTPGTPMGLVQYRLTLRPAESRELVFKVPIAPIPELSPEARILRKSKYNDQHNQQVAEWTRLVGKQSRFHIPEEKVQQTLLANTIFSILAIDKIGNSYIPNVNKFQYHRYYPTDTSLMAIALDDMGQHVIAGQALLYGVKAQSSDGSFVRQPDLWESFGHILWAWNRHFSLTQDNAFLNTVYPAVQRAMNWEINVTSKDRLGLMPPTTIFDDAFLRGCHQTGQDLWTLIGIKAAIQMAEVSGKKEDIRRYQVEYDRFRKAFDEALAPQTAKTGGYIPPALDHTLAGNDWDNLHLLYPEPLFDPMDPRVTATDSRVRGTFQEGILPFILPGARALHNGVYTFDDSPRLHYWHTPDVAENELVRGLSDEQEDVVKVLYALLVHTTSTHATQEFGAYPWSTRDYMTRNILPDGSTSAVIVELVRNMLIREYKHNLHLFSAVSPEWLKSGKSIAIVQEPTTFGPVSASMQYTDNALTVDLSPQFRTAPARLIIHIPWFYEAANAEVDGHSVAIENGVIVVPAAAKVIRIPGRMRNEIPSLSYASAVGEYKAEYISRYQKFLRTGDGPTIRYKEVPAVH